MASKRLAATKAELEEVTAALQQHSSYLGISASDLSTYVAQLREKERLLSQIAQLQVKHLKPARPAPPGPAATFDRCSLPNVVQHMLDYEAVASECTKALRALASLAYNDVNEVAAHGSGMAQLLRLVQLHSDDNVQLWAMKCLTHLAFSPDVARRELANHDVLDVLMAARFANSAEVRKYANEATARIITAESSGKRPSGALLHIFRAEAKRGMQSVQSPTNLQHILSDLEEFDVNILVERFVEAAPAGETCEIDEAVGWLSLLVNLLGQIPLVCPAAVTITTSLMDAFPGSCPIQKQGVAAMSALAASGPGGPLQLAEGKGVKRVEAALGAPAEDAELPASCINFLVSVLDWPFEIQKLCDVDYLRVVSLTKEAMQRHLDVVSFQVAALQGLAKIVEVLSVASDMKAGGAEGLIKTVLAHHKDQKQVWTWGRILLDNMGLDRHWTLREK